MSRRLLGFLAILMTIVLLAFGTAGWLWWDWAKNPKAVRGNAATVRVTVPPGSSVMSVGRELETKGLIRSARAFAFLGRKTSIKPGVYDLLPSEAPRAILRRLHQGDIATNQVTFPEGFTIRQIARRLQDRGLIPEAAAFEEFATKRGNTLEATFSLPTNLEGYLFPDTYRMPVGATGEQIAQRMLDTFSRLISEKRADELRASGRTLPEIVTVGSLIEREAEVAQDRPKIAGVIYNRLKRGMKLQIDATVQYARIQNGGQHASRLLFRDLDEKSPYNTYQVAGLPVGPICNPGLASLEAALKPEQHDYLFYVASADGSHLFAKTFDEHQANIARVRRAQRTAAATTRNP